jgi:hypothetical protein
MDKDSRKLVRTAQNLIVEIRRGSGSPPKFSNYWEVLWGAKVDRIEINCGDTPSAATIWFPEKRWHELPGCNFGDNVRIQTDAGTVIFMGFITSLNPSFCGGTESTKAFERNAFVALSYRWLLATTSPIFGQYARGVDDYDEDGAPIEENAIFLSGQRTIFNPDGHPNMDSTPFADSMDEFPLFANSVLTESSAVEYWTAYDMLQYILSSFYNVIHTYWPIANDFFTYQGMPGLGLDDENHEDWNKVLNNIVVEGLNVVEAIMLLCKHLGWGFREEYRLNMAPYLVFYKIGEPTGWTILHSLHAPAVGESIAAAVDKKKKLLWAMDIDKNITSVINNPWGLGMRHQFEITAELVPAWLDADLEPDFSEDNANLFFTEAELQKMTDKNLKDYFKNYHPRGSGFRREVGRKWALNESGLYSNVDTYNRGPVFDFSSVIPDEYIRIPLSGGTEFGRRLFAPFNRQLLSCLTTDKGGLSTVGIIVEFCLNGNTDPNADPPEEKIWQVIPCSISSLKNECGIYIDEANLAEIVDIAEGTLEKGEGENGPVEGTLEGVQLNYWSSLCDDKLCERSFYKVNDEGEPECNWRTRVRITASIQMDRRLLKDSSPSNRSGSPFLHSQIYNFSEKYGLLKRMESSKFDSTDLPFYERDDGGLFEGHLDAIRQTNEDQSVSGQLTLEQMWLDGKNSDTPTFAVGDCLKEITGREFSLSATIVSEGKNEKDKTYPEIIKIIYMPDQQKEKLIIRDLRFAEVLL